MAGGLTDTSAVEMPDTPAAGRAGAVLAVLQTLYEKGPDAIDLDDIGSRVAQRQSADDPEHVLSLWTTAARRLGPGHVIDVQAESPYRLELLIEVSPERRVWLNVAVEDEPPHNLFSWHTVRALGAGMEIREIEPRDAVPLARLEREAPIVQGDKSMRFEHDNEDNYFDVWPLRNEAGGAVTTKDGAVIASLQVSIVPMRIAGKDYRACYAHRIRTHPAHLGHSLTGQMTEFGLRLYPFGTRMDAVMACIGAGNEAMLGAGWKGRPGEWPNPPVRLLFDVAALADGESTAGAISTPALGRVVELLNATHEIDEGYMPYTVESFSDRLGRAPTLYGTRSIIANDHAVLGVWEAGTTVRTIVTTPAGESAQRRAVIADWAVEAGHEDWLVALLRRAAARVGEHGLTHIALYTSQKSVAFDTLAALAVARDDFHMWSQAAPLARDAADRGAYVDALAF